ncbi:GlxA family transcriptional regulator [Sciscionella sediminilitoris]|uniref:GlxA family transcriptional regulator n=1 Tax=Sciscionella sediminilitoris TaxID=1445613 RepID=UPI000B288D17|nr:helix-turn-helix domain-containing protein [Sciscionella sp. SE31]
MPELRVAILAVPRTIPLDFSIPAHILGGCPGYEVIVCADGGSAPEPGVVPTHPLSEAARADIVVVPGYEDPEKPLPEEYLEVLRTGARRDARVVAICTGAFALAASGVLDGRKATAHWRYLDRLRELYPMVEVLENRLFVVDGNVLTSAGAGAGIDVCLHLIASDFGAAAAHEAGREVIASPVRDGTGPQYVDVLTPPRSDLSATRAWAMAHLGEPISVESLARQANLPRRTFIRHFERETGFSPMRWVGMQRILSARRLLATSDWTVERIASATGFGTAANFRTTFRREVGSTPSAYRRAHLTR